VLAINNQQSTINNQQSTINNQQSTINNQQSTINNQQSTINKMHTAACTDYCNHCQYSFFNSVAIVARDNNIKNMLLVASY
jgi:autotransporter adhesin